VSEPTSTSLTAPPRRPSLVRELRNVPNLLTLARIAIVPFVVVFIDNYSPTRSFVATILYIVASVTDFFDGYLARRWGQITVLGKFLDPLADKVIVMAALVFLVAADRAPAWLVVLLLARELAITGLRSIASTEGLVIAASTGGKHKTALQLIGILFLMVHFRYPILGTSIVVDYHAVGLYTLYLSAVLSIHSAYEYIRDFGRAIAKREAA
jgi:CDP-diacylglycerol--glycerol-3-phosphate 3-phosphatidyltransferase